MKILIGNSPVELNFANYQAALITRALIVMSAEEEIGVDGFNYWKALLRKHSYLQKAYSRACNGAEN